MNLMNFDSNVDERACRAGAADDGAKRYQDTAFLEQPKEWVRDTVTRREYIGHHEIPIWNI